MADRSAIEWTDATWNPIVGCSLLSPGCTNCYAMKMAARIERMQSGSHYAGTVQPSKAGPVWTGKVALAPERILTQPLGWRRPRRIFVNSMGDLFHESVSDEWIDRVFAVMALTPQHTYQVLTKRSARMREYITAPKLFDRLADRIVALLNGESSPVSHGAWRLDGKGGTFGATRGINGTKAEVSPWPLPNVWLGVSTEDQRRADERVSDLLATPAAIRFVSAEPLLGPIDFRNIRRYNPTGAPWIDALRGMVTRGDYLARSPSECSFNTSTCIPGKLPALDLVIVGGESGPNARPMHPDWARSLRDQCAAAGTAFFFKQWGEWRHAPDKAHLKDFIGDRWTRLASDREGVRPAFMVREGKARAGRFLDGIEHNAMPEVRP